MSPQNKKRRKKQPKKQMIALPKFVRRVKSHERYYYYYQEGRECKNKKEGQRVRIKAEPHEPQFWQEIARLNGEPPPQSARGTFAALIEEYKKSPEYKALKPKTASEYARYLVIVDGAWGGLHVRGLTSRHVLRIRDSFAETPAKANYLLDVLSSVIGWSIPREYTEINPCQSVKKLKTGKGYAPWPQKVIGGGDQSLQGACTPGNVAGGRAGPLYGATSGRCAQYEMVGYQ